jgi:hypothetical protein
MQMAFIRGYVIYRMPGRPQQMSQVGVHYPRNSPGKLEILLLPAREGQRKWGSGNPHNTGADAE